MAPQLNAPARERRRLRRPRLTVPSMELGWNGFGADMNIPGMADDAYSTAGDIFRYCPQCGAEAPSIDRGRAMQCPACGFRLYHNVGIAVAALVRGGQGRYCFIRRAHEPAMGKLGLPGGFADPGESLADVARREIREETGLAVGELTYLTSCPNGYAYRGLVYATLDAYFHAEAANASRAEALDEVDAIVWLRPEAVDPAELAFDSTRHAVTYLTTEYLRQP